MPRFEIFVRVLVVLTTILTSISPASISANISKRPNYQTEEPTSPPTSEATATETAIAPTEPPTETPTVSATETGVVSPTETATVPATTEPPTDTPVPSVTTEPPGGSDTPTLTPVPSATLALTPTETATPVASATLPITITPTLTPTAIITLTPTLTPTETVTPTLTPEPANLSLAMTVDPAFVTPGELVTVTLTLSNPGQIPVENLIISSTLPAGLSYDQPLGAVTPGFNPLLQLLTWPIPADLSTQPALTVGYIGRVAADAPASAVNLTAEITPLPLTGSGQAQTSFIILAPVETSPTPVVAGPPAQIQLGVAANPEPGQAESDQPAEQATAEAATAEQWVAVYVVDADGLAVADGTQVTLDIQGGQLAEQTLQTENGIATTRFEAPAGQAVTLTAQADTVQDGLAWSSDETDRAPRLDLDKDDRYGEEAQAIVKARNALEVNGDTLTAENLTRQVDFSPNDLTFHLKQQDDDLKGEDPAVPQAEQLNLGFQLTSLRVGQQSLLAGSLQRGASDNWVTYQTADQSWQLAYEVGEASVEQYFVFEKGTPTDGDLVIEGAFDTQLQPVLLSPEVGIQFIPAGMAVENRNAETGLAYGPALVTDAQGQSLLATMELNDKQVRLTIPAVWLAQAEFPVVVDPVIGSSALVSGLTAGVVNPVVASNGSKFLSVWGWQGDIYGQFIENDGTLSGDLIAVSQAAGVQEMPDMVYNPINDEYFVVWNDHRYGLIYNSLRAQRLSASGQPLGDELELLSPTKNAASPSLAVSTAGYYLLVWSDQTSGTPDIYGQMLDNNGVLNGTRLTLTNNANTQIYPDVAYDGQANMFEAVWSDRRDASAYDIYGQQVIGSGVISGSNQQLAGSGDSQNLYRPKIASNGAGQFLASWEREVSSSNYDIQAIRVTASTGQLSESLLDIDIATGAERLPAVTGTSGGNYLLLWRDDGLIQGQVIPSSGSPGGSVFDISDTAAGGFRDFPAVVHGDGQALGIWADPSQSGQNMLTGRRVNDGGSLNGNEIFISPYYNRRERVALAGAPTSSESLLAWQQAADSPVTDIFVQRLDGQGQAIGNPFNLTHQPADQGSSALAAGQAGYLAVWQDNRNEGTTGLDIYGQLLTASGTPTGSLLAISSAVLTQANPAIAYNSQQNNYLVVWDDKRASSTNDIYGQIVNSSGTLGGSFSLSITNIQNFAEVAYNPDRNSYLLVWEDNRTSNNDDIYGQVISADGSVVGSSFTVATTSGYQFDPVVAYQPASQTYLAAWWDNRNGNYDIYGQVISGTGVLSGSNFAIATASGTNNDQEYPDIAALLGSSPGQFLITWHDRRIVSSRDIYGQRVSAAGVLLDEPDTGADETNPTLNIPFETSGHTERPAVSYNSAAAVYLLAWNNRTDGGVYTRRYSPTMPLTATARFTATPRSGSVPLTVAFSDVSSGTIASRTWNFGDGITTTVSGSAPLSHTYLATGTFSVALTVTNPGGSVVTSTLITVTEQTTPSLTADFESLNLGVDPAFWVDQYYNATSRDDFETLWSGDSRTLGTVYSSTSAIYSHYAIPGWAAWQNYDYTGRMLMTDPDSGLGVAIYSRYPAGEPKAYALRRYVETPETESFHLLALDSSLVGDTQLELTPQPNTWYRFRLQATTYPDRVMLRAKVWPADEAEPALWQALAYDNSGTRVTAGAVGVRTLGPGTKYFDDLQVVPLPIQADFSAPLMYGRTPLTVTFTSQSLGQVLTHTWNFGDGASLVATSSTTVTHVYTQAGVYNVSLTVTGPAGSDTFTRPTYITAYSTASLARAYAFGADTFTTATANQPGVNYTKVMQNGQNFTYTVGLGHGYSSITNIDTTPNDRGVYTGTDELYDQFIGVINSSSIIFRVDLPNGLYRFVAAGGDAIAINHSTTVEIQDGASGPTMTLVSSFVPTTTGRFWTADFDDKVVPPADGVGANPVFVPQADSGMFEVTQGYIQVIQRVGAGQTNGGDLSLLEVWRLQANSVTTNFSAFPTAGSAPLLVQFFNNSTGANSYLWRFGDSLTSTLTSPTHTYTSSGVYTVSLTASDGQVTVPLTRTSYITVTTTTVRYVARTGVDSSNNCTNSASPCATVQRAVDQAILGDEVRIATGVYTNVVARAGITQTAYLSKSITLRGGYTTTNWSLSAPLTQPTTLDAQGRGRVLYLTGPINVTIDGLRLTGGNAAGLKGSVTGNDGGGGVYIITATATLSRSQVFSNTAMDGGGLYLANGTATLSGNTISTNTISSGLGGGLFVSASNVSLTGNTIISNTANLSSFGGGIWLAGGVAVLNGNTIRANSANASGGGLFLGDGTATLTNNIIADNQANSKGSGLYINNSSPRLWHTTIARNSGGDGSGIYVEGLGGSHSTVALTNTILVSQTVGLIVTAGNTATLTATLWGSSDWANGTDWSGAGKILTGTTNLWNQPGFIASGDYHLTLTSAALNAGVNAGITSDIDGEARPLGAGYDLGADEAASTAALTLSKTAPIKVMAGAPLTYTLIVTNNGNLTATNLVITDAIPVGAGYLSGGTRVGNVVSWTTSSLASGAAISVTFAVSATSTVTNSNYMVTAQGGIKAIGQNVVTTTMIRGWQLITPTFSPPIVDEQAMAYDSIRNRVVLYGGNGTGWPYQSATWEFTGTNWITISTALSPTARYGASLAYDRARAVTVLFGGSDRFDTALTQTWEYTNATWTKMSPATSPVSRTYASMVSHPISGTVYLFGGNNGESQLYNDVWRYNGAWTQIVITGTKPSARTQAALALDSDRNQLVLFGGRNISGTVLSDLWAFDLTLATWTQLNNGSVNSPPPRQAASLTYDPVIKYFILAGGLTDEGDTLLADTWYYQDQLGWQQVLSTPAPAGEAHHQIIYNSSSHSLILFANGETWKYE